VARFGRRPLAALEAELRTIRDPVEKLRYIRRSLDRFETLDERLQALPGAPLRWVAYRLTGVEEARPLPTNPLRARPRAAQLSSVARGAADRQRRGGAADGGRGSALASYPRARPRAKPAIAATAARRTQPRGRAPARRAPERIWLWTRARTSVFYSNGLRIDTVPCAAGAATASSRRTAG
jgi:hypothetical protein